VSRRVGGTFKVGKVEGTHIALSSGKKIVQTWRANNRPKAVCAA